MARIHKFTCYVCKTKIINLKKKRTYYCRHCKKLTLPRCLLCGSVLFWSRTRNRYYCKDHK